MWRVPKQNISNPLSSRFFHPEIPSIIQTQRLRSITRVKCSLRIQLWRRRYEAMKIHPQTKLPRSRSQSPGNDLTTSHSLENEHLRLVALQLRLTVSLSKGSELSSSNAAKATVLGQILTKKEQQRATIFCDRPAR